MKRNPVDSQNVNVNILKAVVNNDTKKNVDKKKADYMGINIHCQHVNIKLTHTDTLYTHIYARPKGVKMTRSTPSSRVSSCRHVDKGGPNA